MAATNRRKGIAALEETKKPDRKSCMMCGKDAGHVTEECGKLRKFVTNMREEEDRERAKAQREAEAAAETSECHRNGKWAAATDYRRSATEAGIK
eukprot:jgi/Tetstr1/435719/TSEL_024618.t1